MGVEPVGDLAGDLAGLVEDADGQAFELVQHQLAPADKIESLRRRFKPREFLDVRTGDEAALFRRFHDHGLGRILRRIVYIIFSESMDYGTEKGLNGNWRPNDWMAYFLLFPGISNFMV